MTRRRLAQLGAVLDTHVNVFKCLEKTNSNMNFMTPGYCLGTVSNLVSCQHMAGRSHAGVRVFFQGPCQPKASRKGNSGRSPRLKAFRRGMQLDEMFFKLFVGVNQQIKVGHYGPMKGFGLALPPSRYQLTVFKPQKGSLEAAMYARCLRRTLEVSGLTVVATALLRAPGIATRNKDATGGSWPYC